MTSTNNEIPDRVSVNKFGDGISWENFAYEAFEDAGGKLDRIFYKYEDYKNTIDTIRKYVPVGKVLDCGCNIGRWSKLLSTWYEYTGIDQSQKAIKIALLVQLLENENNQQHITFHNNFLWDININNEFDVAFCNNVLQHNTLVEKKRIIPRLYNALKPGGILYIYESTVNLETATQLTYDGWIKLMSDYTFKFLESWQPNSIGLDECYLFKKLSINKLQCTQL